MLDMFDFLIILSVFPLTTMVFCGLIYLISKGRLFNKFYHDVLDWHIPNDEPNSFDGCSNHSHCKICGKEIMQDSQGNWFQQKIDKLKEVE